MQKLILDNITKDWTLFLDRDGVINHEKHNDYVYNYDEFIFYEGVVTSLKKLADFFKHIIIVTNQRGVSKGFMTEAALMDIHQRMLKDVEAGGGRIDAIYYCTAMESSHPNRKPNPGMALQAKEDFPEIDFSKSIMVGNNISDMQFGRNAGICTVFLKTTNPQQQLPHPAIDESFKSLLKFSEALPVL
jgi:D-glycero-D-manno-heptose 1,7-bisphosphate phosphatase